jgi:hypothetical protein
MRLRTGCLGVVVWLGVVAGGAGAQEGNVVEGVVRQETTKEVLAGVVVTIRFGGGNQVHRAKTDEEGRFRLEVPGTGSHEMSFLSGPFGAWNPMHLIGMTTGPQLVWEGLEGGCGACCWLLEG